MLSRHFEQSVGPVPCAGCDVCVPAETLLAEGFRARPVAVRGKPAASRAAANPAPGDPNTGDADPPISRAPFKRGDWIRIDGRQLGQIVRVDGQGSGTRFTVLSAGDLRERKVDPRRRKIELLEEGGGSV